MLVDPESASAIFDSFNPEIRAATICPEFLLIDAERTKESEPLTWLYTEGERHFLLSFHRTRIPGTDYFDIESPYPYGGPICNTDDTTFILHANSRFGEWCRENSICVEFVRFHPMLRNWRFFTGRVVDDRPTVWINLQLTDAFEGYQTRVRTAIRKAERLGVTVEWPAPEGTLSCFMDLYCEAMNAVAADQFYFFPPSYFSKLLTSSKAEIAFCRYGDRVIGAAIFLADGDLLEYHLSGCTPEGRTYAANNLLIHQAAIRAKERGLARFYLGGGTDSRVDNSLFFFKAGFSDCRAEFKFGARVHITDAYEKLKVRFPTAYENRPGRVLFYR